VHGARHREDHADRGDRQSTAASLMTANDDVRPVVDAGSPRNRF
jgi:hypothetical protein